MADGVAITAGSGTTILTDDTGAGGHAQVMKLAISTDGSGTLIPAEATNGLDVDVTRVIPGTSATHLGKAEDAGHSTGDTGVMALGVANEANAALSGTDLDYTPLSTNMKGVLDVNARQPQYWFELDVPGIAAAAYTTGDQIGTLITITSAARATGGTGWINSILYHDDSDTISTLDVVFFNDTPTLSGGDNGAWSISDGDARKIVFVGSITYQTDFGAQRYGQLAGISVPYFCTGTSLYVGLITRVGYTGGAAGTNRIRFGLTRD